VRRRPSTRRLRSSRGSCLCSSGAGGGFLPGGQQQLPIARALVTRPKMLILDEPTEGIQPPIVLEIEEVIESLHATVLTILLVEQYLELALRLADRFVILESGSVAHKGGTEDLRMRRRVDFWRCKWHNIGWKLQPRTRR
jgi:ABC-type branched-subunit amino acid transport system ATPase component